MFLPSAAKRAIAAAALLFVLLASAPAAWAHASLLRSEPADRAVVAQSPAVVRLTFNEVVTPLVFRLVDAGGQSIELKSIDAAGPSLAVTLPNALTAGTHLMSWRVVSADGHPVGGALTFSIGEPSESQPPSMDVQSNRWAIWIAKIGLYLGLFGGIGGAFYAAWIGSRPLARRELRLCEIALITGLLAAACSVGLQGLDALALTWAAIATPRVWMTGLSTSFGLTAGVACVAMVCAFLANRISPPGARWLSATALCGVGLALAASGHASTAEPRAVMRVFVFLHATTIAFWTGALAPLAMAMRQGSARVDELVRFSRAIPIPFAILIGSGIVLAVVQVRQFDALATTDYGLILCGKLAVVAVMLILAVINRRLTPSVVAGDAAAVRRLRRSICVEFFLVLIVFGLVAAWRFTPPPRALLAARQAPVFAHIHTSQAMADIEVSAPLRRGRDVTITLLDGQFGPLAAKEVTMFLSRPDIGIEPLQLPAHRIGDTTWRIEAAPALAPGRWHMRLDILVSDFDKLTVEDDIDLPQ